MFVKDKRVLITGGTGTWGQELTKQLLENGVKEIVIVSRGELAQVNMQRKFDTSQIKFVIGDIRDYDVMLRATKNINYIFHLAALKHVPVCEYQPQEAIKTNIIGTTNLINAAIENCVETVIDISSDKAVEPFNLYGMTKGVGEKLFIQANLLSERTRFTCIRAGNVLGSNGSAIPHFIEQAKNSNSILLTDHRMTRYFMTVEEAIHLVLEAFKISVGGEILVMDMPSYRMEDIAKVIAQEYGQNTKIEETGIRPGEKLHEVLISRHEIPETYKYKDNYYIIMPMIDIPLLFEKDIKDWPKVTFKEFSSTTKPLGMDGAYELLKKGGFL